jgi:hypothetical protein
MKSNKPFGWLVPKRITENRFKINPMAIGLTNLHVPWATGVLVPSRHYHLSPAIVIQPSPWEIELRALLQRLKNRWKRLKRKIVKAIIPEDRHWDFTDRDVMPRKKE